MAHIAKPAKYRKTMARKHGMRTQLKKLIVSQLEDMDVEADDYWGEDHALPTIDGLYHWTDCIPQCSDCDVCRCCFQDSTYEWWFDCYGQPCYGIEIVVQP